MRAGWTITSNAALIGSAMLAANLSGAAKGEVAVVSPKWLGFSGAFAAIAKSGGAILNADSSGTIAAGYSDDPNFTARLYEAGALFAFSAPGRAGCAARL